MTATATATYPNFIAGRSVDATEYSSDLNPSNLGDIVGEFARGTSADAGAAIAAAREAFVKWSRTTPQERFDILDQAQAPKSSRARKSSGRLLSREQGKPMADGIGEAARAGAIFKFFAGEAVRANG